MTDKELIRAEIERLINNHDSALDYEAALEDVRNFIDSLQEEHVSRTSTDIEAAMQEVKEKSEAFTEAHQGEDADTILAQMRGEEPVSEIDFEKELYKAFGQVKNFTLGMRIAKRFYDMGKNSQEHVSDDLEDVTQTITYEGEVYTRCYKDKLDAFACKYPMSVPKPSKRYAKYSDVDLTIAVKEGANWQKKQLMASGTDVTVHIDAGNYPYIPQIELYDYEKDIPLAKEGDKYKVVLIKE